MIKKIAAMVIALAMMLVPVASMASTEQHLDFKDGQIKITVPQDITYRENIRENYSGTANHNLKMTQVFLLFQKEQFYLNLDYISDKGGKKYKMENEKDAMKMYNEMGFNILQEDLVSSSLAVTGDFEDPVYFEAPDGTPYIKQAIRADGSDVVNMVVYLTCMEDTLYKAFVTYGTLDKKKERFNAVSDTNIALCEEIIGTYSDSGYDKKFLSGETEVKPFEKVGKYAIIGFIVGIFFFMIYFFAKQKGKQRRGQKNVWDKEEEVVVRSVRDAYADRGKNPNAKKGKKKK